MKTTNITTELLVENMQETLEFYKDLLDFEIKQAVPEKSPFFAIIKNNEVELMLYARKQFSEEIPAFEKKKMGGTAALYIGVKDISETFENLKNRVEVIQELHSTDYGTKEFSFYDCNGYVLILHE